MIGELNQRARVLACTMIPDGGGGYSESWNTVATLWTRIAPQSGGDVYGPDAVESRVRHKLIIRRNAAIATGQRAAIGTRNFRIHAVLDGGGNYLTLECEELP
ncbi:MAG: phage head closure protein [Proteobacteria bacterium]|nr:phage head closure protein [Pseudomonadota bacterium]